MKKIALALVALLSVALPAAADAREHRSRQEDGADMGSVLISAAERALIGEYYQSHAIPADDLPPGIRKKVARGKPLPPGIAKRFPNDLTARLPQRPGYEYRTIGADVALVEAATGVIVDLVKDALR